MPAVRKLVGEVRVGRHERESEIACENEVVPPEMTGLQTSTSISFSLARAIPRKVGPPSMGSGELAAFETLGLGNIARLLPSAEKPRSHADIDRWWLVETSDGADLGGPAFANWVQAPTGSRRGPWRPHSPP